MAAEPKIGVNRGNAGKGRPKGVRNKRTRETIQKAEASGLMPLDYMLEVLRTSSNIEDKKWAAQQAAPYIHAKLIASHNTEGKEKKTIWDWLEETS